MIKTLALAAILIQTVPVFAKGHSQSEVIADLVAQNRDSSSAYAVLSLGKASSNPDGCERETRNAFAIDKGDTQLFKDAVEAFIAERVVSFELDGCVDGYPRIVRILPD